MKVLLHTDAPGLGDHLQFSTLPEEFKKLNKDFYLHGNCKFRNSEIRELVWDMNPYVKGIEYGEPNAGEEIYCKNKLQPRFNSYINYIEARNGLLTENKYPKIYYKYDRHDNNNFKDKVYIDMLSIGALTQGSFAQKNTLLNLQNFIKFFIENNKNREIFLIKNKLQYTGLDIGVNLPIYAIKNIFEYCDLIKYCNTFITLFSGSMVLASAIKQHAEFPKVITIDGSQHLQSNLANNSWYFENIQYIEV